MKSQVKTKTGTEEIEAYTWQDAPLDYVHFSKMQRNRLYYLYSDEYATLDTETSHSALDCGWVYQWAVKWNGAFIYGRTPTEFIRLLERMRDTYDLSRMKTIIIYIHNMAYDFAYLKRYLIGYDKKIRVLATDTHSPLIVDVFGFRLLCSYKLSNMSLEMFSKNYATTYIKASGEIDYTKVRYQDDELTPTDWFYMFSDVASQHDAIGGYLKSQGYDKAYKAPFTSTGFVRADCRHAAEKQHGWRQEFEKMALDAEQYALMQQAFMGGITIASYKYAGEVVENVGHVDFTSSYPARQMGVGAPYFPCGKASWYGDVEDMDELTYLLDTYACSFLLTLESVQLKKGVTAPYIPSSKCLHIEGELKLNGKVIYADMLTIAVTEIDYKWVKQQYTAEAVHIDKMLVSERGECPEWLKDRVMHYYTGKCTLKHGPDGETDDERLNRERRYSASKALINGIYGLSATRVIRETYKMDKDGVIEHEKTTDKEKIIAKYYNSFNSFMPYQYGVYTTAWARNALMELIETIGYEHFVYCDTDSVFYTRTEETEKAIAAYNDRIRAEAISKGAYIGDNYLGLATYEPDVKRMKALHAKCYAVEEMGKSDYELKVTIAGIPKRSTKWIDGKPVTLTNADELGALEELRDGFTFSHCGGTRCVYIEDAPRVEIVNGHLTELASSAIIENIEKEISDTMYSVGKNNELLHIAYHQILE